jgi:peptide-methionine (R)-S-oxide reductase
MKKIITLFAFVAFGYQAYSQRAITEYDVIKSAQEWKKQLTETEFYVLREQGTERPFSSALLKIKTKGVYICKACKTPLFKSEHKFDSGTGWPSFDREVKGNVGYGTDYKVGYARSEEYCVKCGGHLGHVFTDGPKNTTGLRHCINGAALAFIPDTKK